MAVPASCTHSAGVEVAAVGEVPEAGLLVLPGAWERRHVGAVQPRAEMTKADTRGQRQTRQHNQHVSSGWEQSCRESICLITRDTRSNWPSMATQALSDAGKEPWPCPPHAQLLTSFPRGNVISRQLRKQLGCINDPELNLIKKKKQAEN